jgi:hypothetical protein
MSLMSNWYACTPKFSPIFALLWEILWFIPSSRKISTIIRVNIIVLNMITTGTWNI